MKKQSYLAFLTLPFACSLAVAENASITPRIISEEQILTALKGQSLTPSKESVSKIAPSFRIGHYEWCRHSATGNSKVTFAAVQIASDLELNPKVDATAVTKITSAISSIRCDESARCGAPDENSKSECPKPPISSTWLDYFKKVTNLSSDRHFLDLLSGKGFHPVKISWEDIGRYEGSVWGDRISDVGIWVRKDEHDADSAELALSVRRDSNFRDKVLVVPSEKIKIHREVEGKTLEISLPDRLKDLQLDFPTLDTNVIVSNQFAVVPVPSREMVSTDGAHPPRVAFNFSIFPYGSTNYVVTDVIEGSSEAIVGPGTHQLLYANVKGQKAPFTASRAAERSDLLELERALKAKGMDVDVQRYYLIQIPLQKDVSGVELSNMGTPPLRRGVVIGAPELMAYESAAMPAPAGGATLARSKGLDKVAIGHGDVEGPYRGGAGFRGKRAPEPIRVTVVYFVTPIGEVTEEDMKSFTQAFEVWDSQALWGGSFVVKAVK